MRFIAKMENVIDWFYDTLTQFYFSGEIIACFGVMCYSLTMQRQLVEIASEPENQTELNCILHFDPIWINWSSGLV